MANKIRENLQQVKQALAEKYERLMHITPSTPRKKTYRLRAAKYRRQAEQLTRPE
jgi:hypothetical protein